MLQHYEHIREGDKRREDDDDAKSNKMMIKKPKRSAMRGCSEMIQAGKLCCLL